MPFRLNDGIDGDALRDGFRRDGYAQVRGILAADDAGRIYDSLANDTEWNFVCNDRGRHIDLSDAELSAVPAGKRQQLLAAIHAQATTGFQYCYNNYPIFDAHRAGRNLQHELHRFYEWLNGEAFLEFVRGITGFPDISFADAQATCFKPGHFLTVHDDHAEGKHRRAAYVFNFTRDWRADWGGYLQLLNDDDDIRHAFRPRFNTLNLLAVPQKHNVGIVAPFAGGSRLSVTGWLRFGIPE